MTTTGRVRKRPTKRKTDPLTPSDEDVIDAINDHQAKAEASKRAHQEEMLARERLVEVMRARGVTGFAL